MPTFGAHFPEDLAEIVEAAARVSDERKVGPWITEACLQRLKREGKLPEDLQALVFAAAKEVGLEKALELLRTAARAGTEVA